MIKNKLLFRVYEWRFNRLHISFEKWRKRFYETDPLSEMRLKCLAKEQKIIRERRWLLDHMYPNL